MRAKLSVIVPTLNAQEGLQWSLSALAEGLEAGLIRELIITDGGSCDDTLRIADEAGALVVSGHPSRGEQLRRGAEEAKGDWLLFLHADCQLPQGWAEAVDRQIKMDAPAVFLLDFDASSFPARIVAAWANLRTRVLKLPYGDQGLLISRRDYDAAGGYREIPLMEDVAIVRDLRVKLSIIPLAIQTSAAKYNRDGWLCRGTRNLVLLTRYLLGADPEKLVKRY
ncbi:MAG: TIGR04283 family arsenosugar biosynthesis glycosyltransferase [Pseudomonadota bacterium]